MHNPKYLFLIIALLAWNMLQAQDMVALAGQDEGWMRSEAKLLVVGAVVLAILAGLLIYLVRLDRKISKLEKGKLN